MDERIGALSRAIARLNNDGLTYREMSRRAARHGYSISHATFANLADGAVAKAPTDQMLHAIASGTGLPYAEVRAATFAQWYGYVPREHWVAEGGRAFLPADLPAADQDEIMAMVDALVETKLRQYRGLPPGSADNAESDDVS